MPAKGRRGSLIGCLPIIVKSVALLLIRLLQSLSRQSKMGSSVTHNKALLPTSGRAGVMNRGWHGEALSLL